MESNNHELQSNHSFDVSKRIINVLFALAAFALFASCSAGYVEEQPTYVEVYRPVQPAPHYVWVNENYVWRNRAYQHRSGYWVKPRPNRVYVEGHWKKEPRGYRWTRGQWK